jgi:hypothetical protein
LLGSITALFLLRKRGVCGLAGCKLLAAVLLLQRHWPLAVSWSLYVHVSLLGGAGLGRWWDCDAEWNCDSCGMGCLRSLLQQRLDVLRWRHCSWRVYTRELQPFVMPGLLGAHSLMMLLRRKESTLQ